MIYVLNKDLEIRSVLINGGPTSCPYFNDELVEKLENGTATYVFECPADHESAGYLESTGYIMRSNLEFHILLFKIREITEEKNADGLIVKRVFCESAALELLLDVVRPTVLGSVTAGQAVTSVLQGTGWQTGTIEWLGVETFEFKDYPTVLAALQEINERYGGDIVFRVDTRNGRVTGKYVDLLQKRGDRDVFRFDYTVDILEISRTVDTSMLVTALIGVGKSDDAGNSLTFTNVSRTFTKEDGTVINKPVGLDYVGDPGALQRFGDNGRHRFGVFKTEETDPDALLKRTFAALEKYAEPMMNYSVKVAMLSRLPGFEGVVNVSVGDSGFVVDHSFVPSLMVNARVLERVTSFSDPSRDEVVIGNFVTYQPEPLAIIERLQDYVRVESGKWEAGGDGELIWKGPAAPVDPAVDDLWLDSSTSPEVLKRWTGTEWKKASPTAAAEIGAETPEGAQDKADEAYVGAVTDAALDATEKADAAEAAAKDYADDVGAAVLGDAQAFTETYGQKKIVQGTAAPADPAAGDLWIDTSSDPHVWKRWDGSAWDPLTLTEFSQLAGQIAPVQIPDLAIDTAKLANDAVTVGKILDGAIESAKIAAGAVTSLKIFDGAITNTKLADLAVDAAKLANSAVTATKIANLAVGTAAIQDSAITNAKIANLDASKITTGTLDAGRVQIGAGTTFAPGYDPSTKASEAYVDNALDPVNDRLLLWQYADTTFIDGGSIYTNSITANQIAAGAITTDKLGANAVTAAKIAADTITAAQIAANAITVSELAANAVTAVKIAADAVTADKIAANAIYSEMIATVGLDASVIKFGTMSGDRIQANSLDAAKLKAGSVIANDITFTGALSGATGTFSGSVVVGDPSTPPGGVTIENGVIDSTLFVNHGGGVSSWNKTVIEQGNISFIYGDVGYQLNGETFGSFFAYSGGVNVNGHFLYQDRVTLAGGAAITNQETLTSNGGFSFDGGGTIGGTLTMTQLTDNGQIVLNPNGNWNAKIVFRKQNTTYGEIYNFYNGNHMRIDATNDLRLYAGSVAGVVVGSRMTFTQESRQTATETGYCGTGSIRGSSSATTTGVGVNFRVKKTYTPSSISLTPFSSNVSGVFAIDITPDGFWLYITGATSGVYYYWRGNYTA